MSKIVTFYSYKGGVGRTFALANIGVLLAQQGKRVLLLDLDLEAPGLDRFFSDFLSLANDTGMIQLLQQASTSASADWRAHVTSINVPGINSLRLIPSGSFASGYAESVQEFSWRTFFVEQGGGAILERWRSEWKTEYDFVLIDSRTGITDTGGVCTILMPDFLVVVFTANRTSLEGAIAVTQEAQKARAKLAVPRDRLTVLPLPSRFDGRAEMDVAEEWLKCFSMELEPFYQDWLPKRFKARQILDVTKIPYVTKFSFGEPLPVLVHGVTDPDTPGFFLANAARLLTSEFRDAGKIIAPEAPEPLGARDKVVTLMARLPIDEIELYRLLRQVEEEEGSGPALATLLHEVGSAFYYQNNFPGAEPFFRRSLAIDEEFLGPDHLNVARDLTCLARLLRDTHRVEEAEPLYKRSLAIREKAEGPEQADVAASLSDLALLLKDNNRHAEAEPLFRRSLAIREKALGLEHAEVADSLNSLAWLLKDNNRHAEAEPLIRRALKIKEKTLGPEHPEVAKILNGLAWLLKDTDHPAQAEPLFRRALVVREKALGLEHAEVADSLNSLAWLLKDTGRHAEAESLFRRALTIREKVVDLKRLEHPDLADTYNNLAWLLKDNNRHAEAESLFQKALSIDEKSFGREHPAVARDLSNLAELYAAQGEYAKAETFYKRALAIMEKLLIPERRRDVTTCLENYGQCLRALGRPAEAASLEARAREILAKSTH